MKLRLAFLEKMNPRERRLLNILGVFLGVVFLVGLPIFMVVSLSFKRSEIQELRAAADAVQAARVQVRDRQIKKDAIMARYQNRAPELGGFIDQKARAQKLEITETTDRPAIPVGTSKRYTERSTLVRLKKAGLLPLSEFFASIEQAPNPVTISKLNLRKRDKDSYDIELVVSAFDRVADAPEKASAGGTTGEKTEKSDKPNEKTGASTKTGATP